MRRAEKKELGEKAGPAVVARTSERAASSGEMRGSFPFALLRVRMTLESSGSLLDVSAQQSPMTSLWGRSISKGEARMEC